MLNDANNNLVSHICKALMRKNVSWKKTKKKNHHLIYFWKRKTRFFFLPNLCLADAQLSSSQKHQTFYEIEWKKAHSLSVPTKKIYFLCFCFFAVVIRHFSSSSCAKPVFFSLRCQPLSRSNFVMWRLRKREQKKTSNVLKKIYFFWERGWSANAESFSLAKKRCNRSLPSHPSPPLTQKKVSHSAAAKEEKVVTHKKNSTSTFDGRKNKRLKTFFFAAGILVLCEMHLSLFLSVSLSLLFVSTKRFFLSTVFFWFHFFSCCRRAPKRISNAFIVSLSFSSILFFPTQQRGQLLGFWHGIRQAAAVRGPQEKDCCCCCCCCCCCWLFFLKQTKLFSGEEKALFGGVLRQSLVGGIRTKSLFFPYFPILYLFFSCTSFMYIFSPFKVSLLLFLMLIHFCPPLKLEGFYPPPHQTVLGLTWKHSSWLMYLPKNPPPPPPTLKKKREVLKNFPPLSKEIFQISLLSRKINRAGQVWLFLMCFLLFKTISPASRIFQEVLKAVFLSKSAIIPSLQRC